MIDGTPEMDTREIERKLRDILAGQLRMFATQACIEAKIDKLLELKSVSPSMPRGALAALEGCLDRYKQP